ncbi:MAG TPA: M28 family peptidase [Gemmatimonadaceae bacterium]|nr:M28 family peptidase [Gemmatimonadaceae bacterium]
MTPPRPRCLPGPMLLRASATLLAIQLSAPLAAQSAGSAPAPDVPQAISEIRRADLERDLYTMAGDSMRGREAGTLDEMRASMWLAEQMRQIGLVPKGGDGSWFQWWNMRVTRISDSATTVRIGARQYALWTDVVPVTNTEVTISAPTKFVGDASDSTIDLHGSVAVAMLVAPPESSIRTTTNTHDYNYARAAITHIARELGERGAEAVILVADSVADGVFDDLAIVQARGRDDVVGGVPRFSRNRSAASQRTSTRPRTIPVLLVHRAALGALRAGGQRAEIHVGVESFEYPSVNIIGAVPGTDPALRGEYVVFSSHQDHDGVRYSVAGDSIWNGADDNASTSVALLAIARAWVKQPSKRSALFIFHGAEERGLLGSRYHVAHPVVPLDSIVALLNGDMIGRNDPDTAALLGSQPPHRNSAALVEMAIEANQATSRFVIDSSWDRPSHPEGWYFRSDHVPYAERGVPALFFSTNLHSDYHTPRDEPKRIDYEKLTRMTRWMYMTGWIAGNAAERPAVDSGFVLR